MRGARPLLAAVGCALALLLAGCTQPATLEPTSDPSPSASPAASPSAPAATPTVVDPPAPAPSPTASPASGPSVSPPPATPAAAAPYCGDEYVLSVLRTIVGWEGDREQQLAMARPQPTFEPADVLAGLDVICVATFRVPIEDEDEPAVAVVSEALLERDDDAFDVLADWASEHYYESRFRQGGSFIERDAPPEADGSLTRKIFWAPLDGDEPTIANAAEIVRLTGAPPDAILVWHADFTRE